MAATTAPPKYLRLRRCPECGEWRNGGRNILCLCDALVCTVCEKGRIRKPISDHYDEADGEVWHTPWLMGLRSCPECGAGGPRAWAHRAAA